MAKDLESKLELTAVDGVTKVIKGVQRSVTELQTTYNRLAVSLGIALPVAGLALFMNKTIEARSALDDLADTTGDSVRLLDGLRRQAIVSGMEFDQLSSGLAKFSRNLNSADQEGQNAGAALKAIGLSAAELRQRKPGEALIEVAMALSQFEDGASKGAVAGALLGKEWAKYVPFLKDIAEQGGVAGRITNEQAAAAERLEKEWRKLKLVFDDGRESLATALIPELTKLLEQMREGIRIAGGFGNAMRLFGMGMSPFSSPGEQVNSLMAELDTLKAKQAGGRFGIRGNNPAVAAQIADVQRKLEFARFMQRQDALSMVDDSNMDGRDRRYAARAAGGKPLNFREKDAAQVAQEMRTFTTAMQRYEEQLGKVNDMSVSERAEIELTTGSLKDLTEEHKDDIRVIAGEIDVRQQLIKRMDLAIAAVTKEQEAWDSLATVKRQAAEQDRDYLEQLDYEVSLIGKSRLEQERMNELRKIDLQLRERLRAVGAAAGDDPEALARGRSDAFNQADRQRRAVNANIDERLRKEREWSTGARQAIDDYLDHATNAAEQTRNAFTNAFQSMEDAFVNFVKTGKLDFRSLADSIINDILRIQFRAQAARILGGAGAGGLLDSIFSGNQSPAPVEDRAIGGGLSFGEAEGFATGGSFMVGGHGGTDSQLVAFRASPNERVTIQTPDQQRGAAGTLTVHVHNNFALGVQSTVRAEVMNMMPMITETTRRGVIDAQGRGAM